MKESFKIGVLSDSHMNTFNDELLFLNDEIFKEARVVFHCGDVVKQNILDVFHDKDVYGVSGNMDGPELKRKLPPIRNLKFNNINFCILHGIGYGNGFYDKLINEFPQTNIFLYGHTHNPEIRKLGNYFFFNPGSFSYNRSKGPERSAGIIELKDDNSFSLSIIDLSGIAQKKFKITEVLNGTIS